MTERRRYTKRQKVTAVLAAEVSTLAAAAEGLDIPVRTLGYWMDQPEFAALRLKTREDMAEEARVLAHRTLATIGDKLGQFEPRDLSILFGVLVDKSQLLNGMATGRVETRDLTASLNDHETDTLRKLLEDVTEAAALSASEGPGDSAVLAGEHAVASG